MFTNTDRADHSRPRRLDRVTIARPGGNDTAIVWDRVPRGGQQDMARRIQENYPGVEQVMFVEDGPYGRMTGGEFCGNATRSLGYLLLGRSHGSVTFGVSGASKPVTVVVDDRGARTSIPAYAALDSVQHDPATGAHRVDIEGISFLVDRTDGVLGKRIAGEMHAKKRAVLRILEESGLAAEKAASGVILLEDAGENGVDALHPYVYVRDTKTLYYETACGSGTTAAGLVAAKTAGRSVLNRAFRQPSGMDLIVSVERDGTAFLNASVGGPVEIVFDGPMYLADRAFDSVAPSP